MPRRCRRATSSSSRPATARCSAATRSSSRRRPRRSSPTSRTELLYASSKAILQEVGYVGAGTCEFLIGDDGTVSFLEVNTRLQVEHPVSEEVTGIDLVREQFRIAEGGTLDYDDPEPRGHSIEFRINGEDPGRGFLPQPGPIHVFKTFGGPGVRVDSGVTAGDVGLRRVRLAARASSSSPAATAPRRSSARAAPSTSSRSPACRPCCPSTARSCATPRSPPRTARSASTPAGSRPSSSTTSRRGTAKLESSEARRGAPHRRRRGRGQAPRGQPPRPHRRRAVGAPVARRRSRRRGARTRRPSSAGASGDAVKAPDAGHRS